eukprot:364852-Chlamydomonas_euryale.AAC.5
MACDGAAPTLHACSQAATCMCSMSVPCLVVGYVGEERFEKALSCLKRAGPNPKHRHEPLGGIHTPGVVTTTWPAVATLRLSWAAVSPKSAETLSSHPQCCAVNDASF